MFVLWSSLNHIPVKYRCLIEKSNRRILTYLMQVLIVYFSCSPSFLMNCRPCNFVLHWHDMIWYERWPLLGQAYMGSLITRWLILPSGGCIRKTMMKYQQKNRIGIWSGDHGYQKCMYVNSLIEYIASPLPSLPIMLTIDCSVPNKI